MPIFNDDDAASFKTNGSGFQFSGIKPTSLGASEYTIVTILVDVSSSVAPFAKDLEETIKSTIKSCQDSPRRDNLLLRVVKFNSHIEELHGFRPLMDCQVDKYDNVLRPGGTTHLYDASVNVIDALATYGKKLVDEEYDVNGLVVIITDGEDYTSTLTRKSVKEALGRAMSTEAMESLVSILIGINVQDPRIGAYLQSFKDEADIREYVEAADATPKTLAKVANFVSKSISSQSQSLKSGQASQPINF